MRGAHPAAAGQAAGQAFLAAPFEANGWDNALRNLAERTRSARGQLIAIGGPKSFPFNCITDEPAGFREEFIRIGGGSPKVNWRVACTAAPLEVVSEHHYDKARKVLQSEVYDEYAERYDSEHGCQTVLLQDADQFFGLAMLRTRSDGRTTAADRAVFGAASPFALAGIQLQKSLEHEGALLLAGVLEAMRVPAFVLDGRGRVGAVTAAGEEYLSGTGGLRVDSRRLYAARPAEDALFQSAIRRIIDAGSLSEWVWLAKSDDPLTGIRCEMYPLPHRDWNFGFQPRLVIVLHSPADLGPAHRTFLERVLHLTNAEADVAALAADGHSREEIAGLRGSSSQTVNAQLKNIFRKVDVRRESELVALINRLSRQGFCRP